IAGGECGRKFVRDCVELRSRSNGGWMEATGCAIEGAICTCAPAQNPRERPQVLAAYGLQDLRNNHQDPKTKSHPNTMCLQITLGENHGSGHFYLAKTRTFLLCVDTKGDTKGGCHGWVLINGLAALAIESEAGPRLWRGRESSSPDRDIPRLAISPSLLGRRSEVGAKCQAHEPGRAAMAATIHESPSSRLVSDGALLREIPVWVSGLSWQNSQIPCDQAISSSIAKFAVDLAVRYAARAGTGIWYHFGIKTPVKWLGLGSSDRVSATVSLAVRICPSFSNPVAHRNLLNQLRSF